jgi:hypothetical protein
VGEGDLVEITPFRLVIAGETLPDAIACPGCGHVDWEAYASAMARLAPAATGGDRDPATDDGPEDGPPVRLVVLEEEELGRPIDVTGSRFLVGRDAGCHLRLEHPAVSGQHLTIVRRGGRVLVHDLGSTNGTILNGAWLGAEPAELADGDRIEIPPLQFTVSIGQVVALPAPEEAEAAAERERQVRAAAAAAAAEAAAAVRSAPSAPVIRSPKGLGGGWSFALPSMSFGVPPGLVRAAAGLAVLAAVAAAVWGLGRLLSGMGAEPFQPPPLDLEGRCRYVARAFLRQDVRRVQAVGAPADAAALAQWTANARTNTWRMKIDLDAAPLITGIPKNADEVVAARVLIKYKLRAIDPLLERTTRIIVAWKKDTEGDWVIDAAETAKAVRKY